MYLIFCLPHLQHTFFGSVCLLLYLSPYCSPLENRVPRFPSFWEEYWDTKKLVGLEAQCISFFPTFFNVFLLFLSVLLPLLHPSSLLPASVLPAPHFACRFSMQPSNSSTTHQHGVEPRGYSWSEGHAGLGVTHRAGGQSSPRDLADYLKTRWVQQTRKVQIWYEVKYLHLLWPFSCILGTRDTEDVGWWLLCREQRGYILLVSFSYSFTSDWG